MTNGHPQKFKQERPYAKPEAAARKLIEIARTLPVDKGRMCVGKWNDLFRAAGGSVDEYAAGRDQAIADGVLVMHECGGCVMFAEAQADFHQDPSALACSSGTSAISLIPRSSRLP